MDLCTDQRAAIKSRAYHPPKIPHTTNKQEVFSSFHFGYLWARQKVETEIDAVVFEENAYGWCVLIFLAFHRMCNSDQ